MSRQPHARPLPGARVEPAGNPAAAASDRVATVTPELVWRLMTARGYPLASVLMPTVPAPVMLSDDVARLRRLVAVAVERLEDGGPRATLDAVAARLDALVEEVTERPTGHAVALYAGRDHQQAVRLPSPVRERVVVDPSYATRDLVRALHRTPRHVLLILDEARARLFEGVGGALTPADGDAFPVTSARSARPDGRRRRGAPDRAFLRSVDRALAAYLADHPAPLVLAGQPRVLATFRDMSRNLARLAGTIPGSHGTASLPVLQARLRPVLDAYLHARQDDALDLLARRAQSGRVVSGIRAAWTAAGTGRPEMLAVEDGLYVPARVGADGELLPAWDVTAHGVLDDAVDELIERVLVRGGWVALVDDGALAAHDGVALTLRAESRR